jgi:hypothetical protein
MPLVLAQLEAGLTAIFKSYPADGTMAAQLIATEYDKYCRTGMAGPGLPILTGAELGAFMSPLAAVFSGGLGPASVVAQAYSTAAMAYWMTPPVAFVGGPATGVSTSMAGAAAIIPAITGVLSNMSNTAETAAKGIAAALHAGTQTVLVVYATPQPTPPPPSFVM